MRLTPIQENLLRKQAEQNIYYVEDISQKDWKKIQTYSNHETLWQDAQRFLSDLLFEKQRNSSHFGGW